MNWGLWIVCLVLLLPVAFGANIHGTIYDIGLNKVTNAVVEINTTPKQVFVAKNGTYAFSVPPGDYTLSAKYPKQDLEAQENITAKAEGEYVLDLILFPNVEAEEELLAAEEPDVSIAEQVIEEKKPIGWLVWIVVFVALGVIVYVMARKPKEITKEIKVIEKQVVKEKVAVAEELQQILDFLEKEGGRTTQKDVRKNFPFSEAKISLMLDELEAKGLIKKVKKGRGNLILKA